MMNLRKLRDLILYFYKGIRKICKNSRKDLGAKG